MLYGSYYYFYYQIFFQYFFYSIFRNGYPLLFLFGWRPLLWYNYKMFQGGEPDDVFRS